MIRSQYRAHYRTPERCLSRGLPAGVAFPFRRSRPAVSLIGFLAALALPATAGAQAIERHLPPVNPGQAAPLAAPKTPDADQDPTPIGPALRALVILGPTTPVQARAADGVDLSAVPRLAGDAAAVRAVLAPYLGHPLSRQLIAQVGVALAQYYRSVNHPFVAFATPVQDITDGVLQIRAVEFTAGDIKTKGASKKGAAFIASHIDLKSGEDLDSRDLTYDITWLNRYPYRQVQPVLAPGKTLGQTDLMLVATETRPFQVYAGYNNSGSPELGLNRYTLGGSIGSLLGPESLLSYQATGSEGVPQAHPQYISQALVYVLPTFLHQQLEMTTDDVETNQATQPPFAARQKIGELNLGYRFAVSDLYGDHGLTDMRLGIEAKHQTSSTLFGGVDALDTSMEVYQTYLGYHHSALMAEGASDFDIALHFSPGGLDSGNSAANFDTFSHGRLKTATYSYGAFTYNRSVPLAFGTSWRLQVLGQFTGNTLPTTEQAGLGGSGLVRGYSLDDGAFDSSLVVKDELRLPSKTIGNLGWAVVSPYLFLDMGRGRDNEKHTNTDLASTGAGADIALTQHVYFSADAAYALERGPYTHAASWRLETALNVSY